MYEVYRIFQNIDSLEQQWIILLFQHTATEKKSDLLPILGSL